MKTIINYICVSRKSGLLRRVMIQILLSIIGILVNFIFCNILAEEHKLLYLINQLFFCTILFQTLNLYMEIYEGIKKGGFDVYIATTPLGLRKVSDALFVCDTLFFVFSYIVACCYIIMINCMFGYGELNNMLLSTIGILCVFYIVKHILMLLTLLLKNVKHTTMIFIILLICVLKLFDVGRVQGFFEWPSMFAVLLIASVGIYIALRRTIEMWWKRGI